MGHFYKSVQLHKLSIICISIIAFLFGFWVSPPGGFSAECPQERKTTTAPKEFYNKTNPLPGSPENIESGQKLYQKKLKPVSCIFCHGEKGDGQGKLIRGMRVKPRNFTCSPTMKSIPDGQIFWIIQNGSNTGMPAYKDLTDEQIWQLTLYLRQLAN
jgi:cytochrome c